MPLVSPFRRSKCPYCFGPFAPGLCAVVAENGTVLVKPLKGWRRLAAYAWLQPLGGEPFLSHWATRQCPNPKCGRPMPRELEYLDKLVVIGLVGIASAGKTTYLTSLLHALTSEPETLRAHGCVEVEALGESGARQRANYNRLFRMRQPLERSPALKENERDEPFIHALVFEGRGGRRRRVGLVVYDAAGEQLENERRRVQFHKYVHNAAALIFLIDPAHLPVRFPKQVPVGPVAPTSDERPPPDQSSPLVQSVATILRSYGGLLPGTHVRVPAAVAISKADVLPYAIDDLRGRGTPDDDWPFSASSAELEAWLQAIGANELLQAAGRFRRRSFHAVSATGHPVDHASQCYPAVTPKRCLEPLFEVLEALGHCRRSAGEHVDGSRNGR